jgi:hypothetical protein
VQKKYDFVSAARAKTLNKQGLVSPHPLSTEDHHNNPIKTVKKRLK